MININGLDGDQRRELPAGYLVPLHAERRPEIPRRAVRFPRPRPEPGSKDRRPRLREAPTATRPPGEDHGREIRWHDQRKTPIPRVPWTNPKNRTCPRSGRSAGSASGKPRRAHLRRPRLPRHRRPRTEDRTFIRKRGAWIGFTRMLGTSSRDPATWMTYGLVGYFAFMETVLGPIMPFLRTELGLDYTTASLHFSAFALGAVLLGLFGDRILGRWGRLASLWGGAFGMTAGAVLLISVPSALGHRPRGVRHGPLRRPGARHLPGAALRQARGVRRPSPSPSRTSRRARAPYRPPPRRRVRRLWPRLAGRARLARGGPHPARHRFLPQAPRPSAQSGGERRRGRRPRPVPALLGVLGARDAGRGLGVVRRPTGGRISWPTERASPARPRPPP